jgi:hypothetical protein
MKFRTCFKSALALLAFTATSAMAVPYAYTIDATGIPGQLSDGTYSLSAGTYQGSFNGSSFLPQGLFSITSLQFSFFFMDDHDNVGFTRTLIETPKFLVTDSRMINSKTFEETVVKTTTSHFAGVGEKESVKLNFGALSFLEETAAVDIDELLSGGSKSVVTTSYRSTDGTLCDAKEWAKASNKVCQKTTTTTNPKFNNFYTGIDYTGEVTFDGSLMGYTPAMKSLMLLKKLNFSLDVLGDIDLISATLDIEINTLESNNTVDVPEPGSVLLFGIALLGIVGIRRKQRR